MGLPLQARVRELPVQEKISNLSRFERSLTDSVLKHRIIDSFYSLDESEIIPIAITFREIYVIYRLSFEYMHE